MHTYRFKITDKASGISTLKIDSSITVLKKRMKCYGYQNFEVSYNVKSKEIVLTTDSTLQDEFINSLLKPLRVQFYECYDIVEVATCLMLGKNDKALIETISNFSKLINAEREYSNKIKNSYIGYVKLNDTSKLNVVIRKLKTYLPADCRLVYENEQADIYRTELYLYALKSNVHKLDVNALLDSAKINFNDKSYPEILVYFNEKGKSKFAAMTRKNIGRSIAILVDNVVYSAPFVHGEVNGRVAAISGSFSIKEAAEFTKILSTGFLLLNLILIK